MQLKMLFQKLKAIRIDFLPKTSLFVICLFVVSLSLFFMRQMQTKFGSQPFGIRSEKEIKVRLTK